MFLGWVYRYRVLFVYLPCITRFWGILSSTNAWKLERLCDLFSSFFFFFFARIVLKPQPVICHVYFMIDEKER